MNAGQPTSVAIEWTLCSMLSWRTTTPLGSPVEPDVYCSRAIVARVSGTGCQAAGSPKPGVPFASTTMPASPVSCAHSRTSATLSASVSTAAAPALAATVATRLR
jgi:hypothetical protein